MCWSVGIDDCNTVVLIHKGPQPSEDSQAGVERNIFFRHRTGTQRKPAKVAGSVQRYSLTAESLFCFHFYEKSMTKTSTGESISRILSELGESHILPPITSATRLEDLRSYLSHAIRSQLQSNPALLMSILYRIDVREDDLLRCLSEADETELPEKLAELIVDRELEKARSRERFRQHGDPNS